MAELPNLRFNFDWLEEKAKRKSNQYCNKKISNFISTKTTQKCRIYVLYTVQTRTNRPFHGFHRHLGWGPVEAKITANVWEIVQLSNLAEFDKNFNLYLSDCMEF